MKIKKSADITQFWNKIRLCSGEVFCKTPEHDCLNLKSALTRVVFITLIGAPKILYNAEIECTEELDYEKLSEFILAVEKTDHSG